MPITPNQIIQCHKELALSSDLLELIDASQECDYDTDSVSSQGDEEEPTEQEMRVATDESFNETLEKIIADADKMAEIQNNSVQQQVHEDMEIDDLALTLKYKTVLGDIFHFMDRAKLPMHHEFKALFFRSLRASVFIMNHEDVDDVKTVLQSKGISWEIKMAFDFRYIADRVRRHVPEPEVLYYRMKSVFEFFQDKKDTTTGIKLFSDKNKLKFNNMLLTVKRGYGSNSPNMLMYVRKTDKFGRYLVDSDGLNLYRSLRGTSNLESLHQYLTTSFGHTVAGPYYSDVLLAVVRHQYNWRMSRKNRPNFPQLMHYEGRYLDRINTLYEAIFGYASIAIGHRIMRAFPWNLHMVLLVSVRREQV